MASSSHSARRRSQRLLRGLPVVVCGESPEQNSFREQALTITFNAHGALLVLYAKVELGQKLLLMNPTTWDDQEARVVNSTASSVHGGLAHVGVEFMRPAPEFWPVNDPPQDWDLASTD